MIEVDEGTRSNLLERTATEGIQSTPSNSNSNRRRWLCATDLSPLSDKAFVYCLEKLARDGDESG